MVPLAVVGAALVNVLFLKWMATSLPLAEFGAVMAVLALPFALTFAGLALQASAASASARSRSKADATQTAAALQRFFMKSLTLSVVLAIGSAIALGVPSQARAALDMPFTWLPAAAPLAAGAGLMHAVSAGATLGSRGDRPFCGLLLAEPVLRFALAVPLFALGLGPAAPIVAVIVAPVACSLFARSRLPDGSTPSRDTRPTPRGDPLSSARALAALIAYGLLVALDVPIVRILLPADEAAQYAGIAAASRFLLLLPMPLSLLLAARLRRGRLRGEPPVPALMRTLGLLLFIAIAGLCLVHGAADTLLALVLDPVRFDGLGAQYASYATAAAVYGVAQGLLLFGIVTGTSGSIALPLAMLAATALLLTDKGTNLPECIAVIRLLSVVFLTLLALVVLLPLIALRAGRRALFQQSRSGSTPPGRSDRSDD